MNELPGLLKAIEIADAYWQYDFKQADNKELTSDDREQAFNALLPTRSGNLTI